MLPEFVHAHGLQGVIHPAADLLGGDSQVFRGEGHVLLHHVGHDLVVGVLEDHANRLTDVQKQGIVGGVHAADVYLAPGGQEDGVHVLGQGGLAATVVAQNGHEGALFNVEVHAVQHGGGDTLGGDVGKTHPLGLNDGFLHNNTPSVELEIRS